MLKYFMKYKPGRWLLHIKVIALTLPGTHSDVQFLGVLFEKKYAFDGSCVIGVVRANAPLTGSFLYGSRQDEPG